MDGHIVRFVFKNFCTYDYAEYFPNRSLNIVSGSNGTGKSSMFNGILFVLNGKTSFINRGKQISSFIQYGKTKAYLEIELYNSKGLNSIISRIITKDASKWTIDYKHVTQKDIQDLTDKYKIDVENLCQFLPQDRVADFAKMNPLELLINTEKAIGNVKIIKMRKILEDNLGNCKNIMINMKESLNILNGKKKQNLNLDKEIEAFNNKRKYIEKIDLMKKKMHWMTYREYRTNLIQITNECKELEKSNAKIQEQCKTKQDLCDQTTKNIQILEDRCRIKTKYMEDLMCQLRKQRENISNLQTVTIDGLKRDYECKVDTCRLSQNAIKALTKETRELEQQIANEKMQEDASKPKLKELMAKKREYATKQANIETEQADLKKRLVELAAEKQKCAQIQDCANNRETYRIQSIKQKFPDAYSAYQWVQNTAIPNSMLRKPIIGPICLNIKTNPQNDGAFCYLENIIGRQEWIGFICLDREDFLLCTRVFRKEMRLNIPIFYEPNSTIPASDQEDPMCNHEYVKHPDNPFCQHIVKQYPSINEQNESINTLFDCNLRDLIYSCPAEVMEFLCRKHRFHEIPISHVVKGNSDTVRAKENDIICKTQTLCSENIEAFSNLHTFFAGRTLVRIIRSRYRPRQPGFDQRTLNFNMNPYIFSQHWVSPSNDELMQEMNVRTNLMKIENELSELQKSYNTLHEERGNLENKIKELTFDMQELMKHRNTQQILLTKLRSVKLRITKEESNLIDLDHLKVELEKQLMEIGKTVMTLLEKRTKIIEKYIAEKKLLETMYYENLDNINVYQNYYTALDEITNTLQQNRNTLIELKVNLLDAEKQFVTSVKNLKSFLSESDYAKKSTVSSTSKSSKNNLANKKALNNTSMLSISQSSLIKNFGDYALENSIHDIRLNTKLLESFETIPGTREALEREIEIIKIRADMLVVGEDVVQAYYERQRSIKSLEHDFHTNLASVKDCLNHTILPTQQQWQIEWDTLLEKINTNFTAYFSRLDCPARVELLKQKEHEEGTSSHDKTVVPQLPTKINGKGDKLHNVNNNTISTSETCLNSTQQTSKNTIIGDQDMQKQLSEMEKLLSDTFGTYGLAIKVKFRPDQDLSTLNHMQQSGGERSLATIFYLLSLQELTQCPFRMVDEINQGMDAHNERKVMDLLVELSEKPNVPQYFLLTPKFLPGIQYGPATNFFILMRSMQPCSAPDMSDCEKINTNQTAISMGPQSKKLKKCLEEDEYDAPHDTDKSCFLFSIPKGSNLDDDDDTCDILSETESISTISSISIRNPLSPVSLNSLSSPKRFRKHFL